MGTSAVVPHSEFVIKASIDIVGLASTPDLSSIWILEVVLTLAFRSRCVRARYCLWLRRWLSW